MVATTESLILSVISPVVPPPARPNPALTEVISPASPVIVIAPFEADVIVILSPAIR